MLTILLPTGIAGAKEIVPGFFGKLPKKMIFFFIFGNAIFSLEMSVLNRAMSSKKQRFS